MATTFAVERPRRELVDVPGGSLEVFIGGSPDPDAPMVCAAHPAVVYGEGTASLVADLSGARAVAVNPRGVGLSSPAASQSHGRVLAAMTDDLEAARRSLGVGRWTFWGMSGGAWLAMVYAVRHPASLSGIVLESGCDCFRTLLADPASLLSPFHPSWRPALETAGLIDAHSHAETGDPDATEWREVDGVPPVFCRRKGAALCVSAVPATPEVRQGMPLLWSIDLRSWLPKIQTRTLVVAGGADRVTPVPRVRTLHEAIAGSRWLVVEGGGHVPMTARPVAIADAVREFLGS
jgi:pimeloyl-ACP methyl ester carboxylesterase